MNTSRSLVPSRLAVAPQMLGKGIKQLHERNPPPCYVAASYAEYFVGWSRLDHAAHTLAYQRSASVQEFSKYGLLSGALFVFANVSSYAAIHLLNNVAVATGIWCGIAMVVSFAFGALKDGVSQSVAVAVGAIVIMVLGVGGITQTHLKEDTCAAAFSDVC